jgi:phosphatidylglycerophosphate synthase
MDTADPLANRRPLKTRSHGLAIAAARWLTQRNISPNQISMLSILFAAIAGAAFAWRPQLGGGAEAAALLVAAFGIQLRLLCNLLDGMVAVEGGKKTPAGELFNDMPDRLADVFIILGAGYSAPGLPVVELLGWWAVVLAVLTAYVRVLGVSVGAGADFRGPMAKQHRMALLTVTALLSLAEPMFMLDGQFMAVGLAIMVAGCVVTLFRRTLRIYRCLQPAA